MSKPTGIVAKSIELHGTKEIEGGHIVTDLTVHFAVKTGAGDFTDTWKLAGFVAVEDRGMITGKATKEALPVVRSLFT